MIFFLDRMVHAYRCNSFCLFLYRYAGGVIDTSGDPSQYAPSMIESSNDPAQYPPNALDSNTDPAQYQVGKAGSG